MILCLPAGTICHEVIGHGVTGVIAGGHITYVEVLGVQLWPRLEWQGWIGRYGACDVEGVPTVTGDLIGTLGGSTSTLLASIAALLLLRLRCWGPVWRVVLLTIGVWWIDMLTYTMPTWGLRRSIFWGGRYAEPYEAAVALGVPGRLFQAGVLLLSAALAYAWIMSLRRSSSKDRRPQPKVS